MEYAITEDEMEAYSSHFPLFVIPAKAGTQMDGAYVKLPIPTFARMTSAIMPSRPQP